MRRAFRTATLAALTLSSQFLATSALADDRPSLRVGVASLPDGFAPSQNASNVGQRINYSLFDHFIKRAYWEGENGDGGALVPSIARSWEQLSPTEWEITLREGVTFHDGTELTAEDIAWNFGEERMLGEDRIVRRGPSYFGTFKEVEATGPYTLRIETHQPDPAFLKRFTTPFAFVVPREHFEEVGLEGFNLDPVGTGPYQLAEFQPGEFVRLEAFDEYWGGEPPVASITFYEIPEFAGRMTALFNGEVDIITNVTPDQVPVIEGREDFDVRPALIDNHRMARINTLRPLMGDKRIRQALAHAIDRELIVDELWAGYSRVPKTMNFPGHGDLYFPERETLLDHDPEKARALLEEAGYDGEEIIFRVTGNYYTNYLQAAQVMQQMWDEVGLNVKIEVRDSWGTVREGGYDILNGSLGMQMNDVLHPIWLALSPSHSHLREGHANQIWRATDEWLAFGERLNTEMDPEARGEAFKEMVSYLEDQAFILPLFQAVEFYGVRADIAWEPYSFWPMDFSDRNLAFAAE